MQQFLFHYTTNSLVYQLFSIASNFGILSCLQTNFDSRIKIYRTFLNVHYLCIKNEKTLKLPKRLQMTLTVYNYMPLYTIYFINGI